MPGMGLLRSLQESDGVNLPRSGFVQQYAAADSQKRRDFCEAKIRATFACRGAALSPQLLSFACATLYRLDSRRAARSGYQPVRAEMRPGPPSAPHSTIQNAFRSTAEALYLHSSVP